MQTFFLSLTGAVLMVVLVLWLFERERKKNRFSPFTEKMLRSPGYTLSNQLQDKGDELLIPILMLSFVPFILVHFLKDANYETIISTGIIFLLPFLWGIRKVCSLFKEIRNLRLGLEGEIYTGQELNYLMRKGAWVYHDIPYKYGNIDHIIISKSGIFTVETKAVRKPMNDKGVKEYEVKVENETIIFPHFTTTKPIKQAKLHSSELIKYLKKKTGNDYPVFSIVALPGWKVSQPHKYDKSKKGYLVVNPKRSMFLEEYMDGNRMSEDMLDIAVREIEEFARSVETNTNITDPDAKKNYSFFLNRKPQEQKL
jgi:hypothetical protein